MAAAAATEDGVLITGLEDKDYKITFSVDPDGTAALQINELVAGTEDVAKTRTVNFDANGNIANISDVEI